MQISAILKRKDRGRGRGANKHRPKDDSAFDTIIKRGECTPDKRQPVICCSLQYDSLDTYLLLNGSRYTACVIARSVVITALVKGKCLSPLARINSELRSCVDTVIQHFIFNYKLCMYCIISGVQPMSLHMDQTCTPEHNLPHIRLLLLLTDNRRTSPFSYCTIRTADDGVDKPRRDMVNRKVGKRRRIYQKD